MQLQCKCGRLFKGRDRIFENRYCSKKCFNKYSTYARHAWLFNRIDLRDAIQK